ncbi:hypothetical protein [Deinococcus hohokamensis]|uniref:Uncharacterized protein n=1 Tax=Deinococcus hohokamensis TaxID=309883 RepID=A0ABV9I965_9DEIO
MADPYAVIDRHGEQTDKLVWEMVAEAARFLGKPAQAEPGALGANGLLPDRTIAVDATQADRECPIQVCLWPPRLTSGSRRLI